MVGRRRSLIRWTDKGQTGPRHISRGVVGPAPETEGGPFVARKRPTASSVVPPVLMCLDGGVPDDDAPGESPAEARRRCRRERLTHERLVQHLRPDLAARPRSSDSADGVRG